jgi:hypothetical protein
VELIHLLPFAIAIAAVSMTVTKATLFKGMRERLKPIPFFGGLVSCPYCFSHWMSALVTLVFSLKLTSAHPALDFLLVTFVLVVMTAPFAWVIFKSYVEMGD